MYRPDATRDEPFNQNKSNEASEKLWKKFMSADEVRSINVRNHSFHELLSFSHNIVFY